MISGLHYRGVLKPDNKRVACIGTRESTDYGRKVAARIVQLLVEDGWTIVSGLAMGIDAACHEAALAAGGHTIAVMGHGLAYMHPENNRGLAGRILEGGGALVSEYADDVPPGDFFVERDRLQALVSHATVVMQTGLQGGTLHCARHSLLAGKPVAAVYVPAPEGGGEDRFGGNRMLTTKTGPEIVAMESKLTPNKAYERVMAKMFPGRPPAFAIRNRDDYPELLRLLSGAVR